MTAPVNVPTLLRVLECELRTPSDGPGLSLLCKRALEAAASADDDSLTRCILVSWPPIPESSGADTREYVLEMKSTPAAERGTRPAFEQLYRGPGCCFVVACPVPGAKYAFRVAAISAAGQGKPGPVATCKCDGFAPDPVADVVVDRVDTMSAKVAWDAPSCNGGTIVRSVACLCVCVCVCMCVCACEGMVGCGVALWLTKYRCL